MIGVCWGSAGVITLAAHVGLLIIFYSFPQSGLTNLRYTWRSPWHFLYFARHHETWVYRLHYSCVYCMKKNVLWVVTLRAESHGSQPNTHSDNKTWAKTFCQVQRQLLLLKWLDYPKYYIQPKMIKEPTNATDLWLALNACYIP